MAYTEKQREYNRRFREKYREEINAKQRKWRREHRAKFLSMHAASRARPAYKEREKERARNARRINPLKFLAQGARRRARELGLACDIDATYLQNIWTGQCPILHVPLMIGKKRGTISELNLASLDRLDNTKGYIKGNVHFVSFRANNIKSNARFEEFEQIYNWWKAQQ